MKWTLFFFTAGTACWTPLVWDDIPLVRSWKSAAEKRERDKFALQFIQDRHAMQQRQLSRLDENVREMMQAIAALNAEQKAGDPPEPEPAAVVPEPLCTVTLYTADESWNCGPCNQQKKYLQDSPTFKYDVIEAPSGGQSPHNRYPCWVISRPDGTTAARTGAMTLEQLEAWHSKETDR